ncbi:MAG: hypothetical protein ACR2FM_04915 [Candidatus Saccharimonadales bacterium]
MAAVPNGSFWIGADGNVWVAGSQGVNSAGRADANSVKYWSDRGYGLEADPNPPQQSRQAPSGGGGGGGGGGEPPKPDRSNSIALQNAGLGAVDQQLSAGIGSIDTAVNRLKGQYAEEATANEGIYTDNSNNNQNNLQQNKQSAMVNAAQGRQGLFGSLASIGALNGSGIDLANRAVTKGANDDLSGAADNYSGNQTNLDTAIGTFRREDKNRRENADMNAENARQNARGDAAKSRMGFYSQLSNDYSAMGDAGNAQKYTGLASSLYPEVARTNVPNANIAYSGAAFTPGALSEYMAGADSTVVKAVPTQPGQNIPGLVAQPNKKKQLTAA